MTLRFDPAVALARQSLYLFALFSLFDSGAGSWKHPDALLKDGRTILSSNWISWPDCWPWNRLPARMAVRNERPDATMHGTNF